MYSGNGCRKRLLRNEEAKSVLVSRFKDIAWGSVSDRWVGGLAQGEAQGLQDYE